MIKAISLDFWGTVAVFNPEYAAARTRYLASLFGLPLDEAHSRYQFVKRSCDNEAELKGTAMTPLAAVKRLLAVAPVPVMDSAVTVLEEIENLVRAYPPLFHTPIGDTVLRLQNKGIIVGVSSNTNFIRGSLVEEIFADQIEWDFAVYSDEIGVSKPDPEFFNMVAKGACSLCVKSLIIHIGDNSVCDLKGAADAGMQSALVKSPEETNTRLEKIIQDISK